MAKKSVTIDNPFVTTGYVGAEYFCDREKETADIIGLLRNGNNVALVSPRRYGKTDLLRHCFCKPEIANNYYTFIIDIYSTKSVSELVSKLGSTILETLKSKGRKSWERFISALSSVKQGISFDMNGMPSWTMSVDCTVYWMTQLVSRTRSPMLLYKINASKANTVVASAQASSIVSVRNVYKVCSA